MLSKINYLMSIPLNERMLALKNESEEIRAEILLLNKEERKRNLIEYWKNLEFFNDIKDIPSLPLDMEQFHIDKLIQCGAIPKEKLEIGKYYYGKCRNSTVAYWDGKIFKYKRFKFGSYYNDEINHFQDDNRYDLFVPLYETEPNENQTI
jgi:hypothetical protein